MDNKPDINAFFNYDHQELFAVLLDLLEVFRDLCKRHDLKFYAQGGTMLGAVRHHGFIPWDDDVDLAMMRPDFNKLLALIETEALPEPYKFLTPLTDEEYGKGLIRLCNTNTTAISVNNAAYNYNHGIFIDIFPLDAIPDGRLKLLQHKLKVKFCANLQTLLSLYYNSDIKASDLGPKVYVLGYYLFYPLFKMGILNKEKIFRILSKTASKYEGKNQKRICLSTFQIVESYINQRSYYEATIIDMPFENTTVPVPETYDMILRNHYGDNYMTPIHEKTIHGDTLFSTTIPYKDFMETYKEDLNQMWIAFRKNKKMK